MINWFRINVLDLESLSLFWVLGLILWMRILIMYCWLLVFIFKLVDWGEEVLVLGFFFLNFEFGYEFDLMLKVFLDVGLLLVYIGFGLIVVDDFDVLIKMIFDVVKCIGVRVLVLKGWGGIGGDVLSFLDNVFMFGNCFYDWLFKKVVVVVYYGGVGIIVVGINVGKLIVVVFFFGD